MRRSLSKLALLLSLCCAMSRHANLYAENYAFLVAVQDYNVKSLRPLKFTRNDIEEFAKVLGVSGFKAENIVLMTDNAGNRRLLSEAEKIRKQFDLLLGDLTDKDTLVVAFAGHGVQFEGEDKTYFCPADADLEDPKRAKLLSMSEIYDKLKACPSHRKLLVVDACRKNPLSDLARSRETVKLQSITRPQGEAVPKGLVALFSCSAGQEAFEWPEFKHGIFFYHFLEGWKGAAAAKDQQLSLDQVIGYAKLKTQSFARNNLEASQTPQLKSDFEGAWIVREPGAAAATSTPAPEVATKPTVTTPKFVTPSGEGTEEYTNSLGMKLRLIPAGEFLMGSPESDKDANADEKPQHLVRIANAFYLGKYEVTKREWKALMETEPWNQITARDDYPATDISWEDAVDFCKELSKKEKKKYRLPTEAEWEYACRGNTKTRYQNGDSDYRLGDIAWFSDNWYILFTNPVGLKRPNAFGLHDMHGNVYEWCSDWYYEKYLAKSPTDYLQGPTTGKYRVYRGGGGGSFSKDCRSARRYSQVPSKRHYTYGFRLALSSKE